MLPECMIKETGATDVCKMVLEKHPKFFGITEVLVEGSSSACPRLIRGLSLIAPVP